MNVQKRKRRQRFLKALRTRNDIKSWHLSLEPLEQRMMLTMVINDVFDGIANDGNPPDPIAAAGPESLLAAVNYRLELFSKDSTSLADTDLDDFFSGVSDGFGSFDPWTIYDRYSDRFIVLAEEVEFDGDERGGPNADEANLLIGVSINDAPADFSDPQWLTVSLPATHDFGGGLSWIDYPKIAADADSVYITGNYFLFADDANQDFQGSLITRLDKAALFDEVVDVTAEIESDHFTIQPAQSVGRPAGIPQLFAATDPADNGIDVFELDDANVFTMTGNDLFDPFSQFTGGAPQPGTTDTLDTLSDRLMNATWVNGSLWTTHTIERVIEQGEGGGVGEFATVRWYEIATGPGTTTEVQMGDIRPGDGIHTYMPAIAADDFGHMGITYTQSSDVDPATMMVAGRLTGQPLGFTLPGQVVRTGAAGFDRSSNDIERWGDYAGIGVDPFDRHTFWAFGEVAESTDEWETVWAQFEVGPLPEDQFDLAGLTNNSLATATVLGSLPKITIRDLTIDDFDDVDYFQYTAQDTGKLIINVHFQNALGDLDLRVFDEHGNLIDSETSISDDERMVIPVVTQQQYFIRVEGFSGDFNVYDLELENFEAPIPDYVDLPALDQFQVFNDTGISQVDDITNRTQPEIIIEADLNDYAEDGVTILSAAEAAGLAATPATPIGGVTSGVAVEVFVNGNAVGFADLIPGTGDTLFRHTFGIGVLPIPVFFDDSGGWRHYVKASVTVFDGQSDGSGDPAPASDRTLLSEPLLLVVDTVPPAATIDGISPDSTDTGVPGQPATMADLITADSATGFVGTAEGGSIVRMYANGVYQGLTTALPDHGDSVYWPEGHWEMVGRYDLNDPTAPFPLDGVRTIVITAEDVAGNLSEPATLDVFIDTQGPQIEEVNVTGDEDYDLFNPKPSDDGPTPPVLGLDIDFIDQPVRVNGGNTFVYPAVNQIVATTPGNYQLFGDSNGLIPIASIEFVDATAAGDIGRTTIRLHFAEPLPDDRFTLIVSDRISNDAGNALDGESNAAEPQESPFLPTGDGVPGGDFIGRFTIDSRPEIGVTAATRVYVDINGNFAYDPGGNGDATNRDLVFQYGLVSDAYFAGDFNQAGNAPSSGFDKLGVFGWDPFAQNYRFLLDFNHNGVADFLSYSNVGQSALPVAGDFAPAHPGDEIGLFTGNTWILDTNGDNVIDVNVDLQIPTAMRGIPVVGDVNGDGQDDLITYDAGNDTFYIDLTRDGVVNDTIAFGIPDYVERPVVGDLNLDGVDDLGLWVAGSDDKIGEGKAEWYFLVSDREGVLPSDIFDAYSPDPLGNDLFANFGDRHSLPIFGNFDPPVVGNGDSAGHMLSYHNQDNAYDVSGNSVVSPLDALMVIRNLNVAGGQAVPELMVEYDATAPFLDVNNDRYISPADALAVIRQLNGLAGGEGEAEGESLLVATTLADESPFADSQIVMAITTEGTDAVASTATGSTATSPTEPIATPDSLVLVGSAWQSLSISDEVLEEDDELEDLLELIADDVQSQWWQL